MNMKGKGHVAAAHVTHIPPPSPQSKIFDEEAAQAVGALPMLLLLVCEPHGFVAGDDPSAACATGSFVRAPRLPRF